jgi:pimeloyl-ACP methyl ester carboxylesterase
MSDPFPLILALSLVLLSSTIGEPVADRITVSVKGSGPDVILIPGLASSGAVWDGIATHLGRHYRLHIVQLAGFSGSPPGANATSPIIEPAVDAIDTYITTNHLRDPKIIGHSLGGLIGLMLSLKHPDHMGSLMIVDSLPFFGATFGAPDATAAGPQAAGMRDTILAESQDAYAQGEKTFLPSLVKSTEGLKSVIQWAIASDKSVVARAIYEDATTDLRPSLNAIQTNVTILYPWDASSGMLQSAVDAFYQQNFASLPHKELIRIDGSFHFIMLDQPGAFASRVDAFLKSPPTLPDPQPAF